MHLKSYGKSYIRFKLFLTLLILLSPVVVTQPDADTVDATTTTETSEDESHSFLTKLNTLISLFNDICTLELNQLPPKSPLAQKVQLLCQLNPNDNSTKPKPPPVDTQKDNSASEKTTERYIKNNPVKADQNFVPEGYDKQVPPRLNENVTLPNGTLLKVDKHVSVVNYIFIRSVRDVDEVNEKIVLDMDLYLYWLDGNIRNHLRNQGRNISLKPDDTSLISSQGFTEKLWVPDIYFEEADLVNRPKMLDEGGQVIWFFPEYGALLLRLRMRMTLQCDMDFSYYPVDTQKCEFHLRSSRYESDEVHLEWSRRNHGHGVYLKEISNPNFNFQVTGVVLLRTFLPSVFFIVVTWLTYLIPARMVEVRIGITMTTLLTMTSMFSSIRENTPIVGYVKAIDIWMVKCVFFIFLTLVALSVGACFRQIRKRAQRNKEELKEAGRLKEKYSRRQKFLENYVVCLLVALFAVLAILYWSWLLEKSDYLNWTANSTYNRLEDQM